MKDDRLISLNAAIKTAHLPVIDDAGYEVVRVDDILALPSARQEIVACGDCIHWICHDRRCGYWNHGVKPLDWCCHAERRTDE